MTRKISNVLRRGAHDRRIVDIQKEYESLKEIQSRFEAVYDHHYQFTGLLDIEGKLIMANKTALAFAGVEACDVIGKPFAETPWWTHSAEQQTKLQNGIVDTR